MAKKADKVYLAADPDREGEAIAWHVAHILKLDPKEKNRIEFNEITKNAIKEAVKNPRTIDQNRVDAQQARRLLDRIVGYSISPYLWQLISSNTSAGRVQSVSLKLICDLEDEIRSFVPEKYWEVSGNFNNNIDLNLYKLGTDRGIKIWDEEKMEELKKSLSSNPTFEVTSTDISKKTKNPPLPLKTSTLQQLASSYLGFSASKTMRVAQNLYEGLKIDGTQKGLITYMRTDSTRISEEAQGQAKEFILEKYGKEYLGKKAAKKPVSKKDEKKIQDAHEAVRPTYIDLEPDNIEEYLNSDQYRLYKLIWERFIISQLAPMKYDQFTLISGYDKYQFRGIVNKVTFDGYYKVFKEEDEIKTATFPTIKEGDKLELEKLNIKADETKPSRRFTESSLVRKLEADGIGRPSTYAAIIETLKKREYVEFMGKSFVPTKLGYQVERILDKYFPRILGVEFTSSMEDQLDSVEDGEVKWTDVLGTFYETFKVSLDNFEKEVEKIKNRRIESDVPCPTEGCSGKMLLKTGRFGKYIECENVETCGGKIPLKTVDIDEQELEAGFIFINDVVQKKERIKKGIPTDIVIKSVRYNLKKGRFGEYLESENYEEDNKRLPLSSSVIGVLRDGSIEIDVEIIALKQKLVEMNEYFEEKETDMITEQGMSMTLKKGRYGEYLESDNFSEDEIRIPLPASIKKMVKERELEEKEGKLII
ncbi:MAG: type I DNA topoisomerase, partial [Psychrilyobacter sp.]|nr:type I DNA topoisomerase [Psychrilyobacter sp.]